MILEKKSLDWCRQRISPNSCIFYDKFCVCRRFTITAGSYANCCNSWVFPFLINFFRSPCLLSQRHFFRKNGNWSLNSNGIVLRTFCAFDERDCWCDRPQQPWSYYKFLFLHFCLCKRSTHMFRHTQYWPIIADSQLEMFTWQNHGFFIRFQKKCTFDLFHSISLLAYLKIF